MNTIDAIYDGRAFVPSGPVDVPPGTRVTLSLPDHGYPGPRAGAPDPDKPLSPEDEAIWRFGTSSSVIARLPPILANRYGLTILPDPATHPEYAGISFADIVSRMERKMSLGDPVMALQIERFAPQRSRW